MQIYSYEKENHWFTSKYKNRVKHVRLPARSLCHFQKSSHLGTSCISIVKQIQQIGIRLKMSYKSSTSFI